MEFHRQVPLLDYSVDFYCHEIGLVIEIDGIIHEVQVLEDAKRAERIEKYGIRFIRFSNEEVFKNMKEVLKHIKKEIEESL